MVLAHQPAQTTDETGEISLAKQIRSDLEFYRGTLGDVSTLRAFCSSRFWLCITYRLGHSACRTRARLPRLLKRAAYAVLNFYVSAITGADIRSGARIGQRFDIHTARGLLITNGVVIGDDCTVNAQVALVNKCNDRGEGVPTLGDGVRVGIGAKLLGRIRIGDRAQIGANAVVLRDVPPGHIAVGIPAACKPRKDLLPGMFRRRAGGSSPAKPSLRFVPRPRVQMHAMALCDMLGCVMH